jgi:hypothetical protein
LRFLTQGFYVDNRGAEEGNTIMSGSAVALATIESKPHETNSVKSGVKWNSARARVRA